MPVIHVALRAGKPEAYHQAIFDSLYQAMRDALDVPEGDQFFIRIIVFATRPASQKKELFRQIAKRLGESPGIRPEDVFVVITDAAKENWSVGYGLAQFA